MAELNAAAPRITDRLCDAVRRALRGRPGPPRRAGRRRTGSSRRSSAASTTTRGRRSSSTSPAREGQQQALGGGGRYDGLVELLGGKPTPGIGFGLGLDRRPARARGAGRRGRRPRPRRWPSSSGADPDDTADAAARRHGAAGRRTRRPGGPGRRKLGKQLEAAAKEGAHFAVILGDELADGQVQLKDLQAGTQRVVGTADLARELARASASHRHG